MHHRLFLRFRILTSIELFRILYDMSSQSTTGPTTDIANQYGLMVSEDNGKNMIKTRDTSDLLNPETKSYILTRDIHDITILAKENIRLLRRMSFWWRRRGVETIMEIFIYKSSAGSILRVFSNCFI